MNKEKINKILFYLYNYENIDDLIEQRKNEIIDTVNVSSVAWIKSKQGNGNTLEDQVIKLIEDPLILEYKRWQVFVKRMLVFLSLYKPTFYKYVFLKFMQKKENDEISKALNLDFKHLKFLKVKLLELIYKNAKLRNLVWIWR